MRLNYFKQKTATKVSNLMTPVWVKYSAELHRNPSEYSVGQYIVRRERSVSVSHEINVPVIIVLLLIIAFIAPTLAGQHPNYQNETLNAAPIHVSTFDYEQAPICPIPQNRTTYLNNYLLSESSGEEESPQDEESNPPYHAIILQAANEHGVDPALIRAVIMAESGYNPNAVSKSGARGLMQLMPRTAKALGVKDSLNPKYNIYGGAKYLRQMLDRFDGDVKLALAAYNAGSRWVRKYRGVPPFKETRNYIKKVLNYYEDYRKEMNSSNDDMA